MSSQATALVIAGSDSSGGAGLQADLRTLCAYGVDAYTALTAVTSQTATAVTDVHLVPAASVCAQIDAGLTNAVDVIKIGMLGNADIVDAVAAALSTTTAPIILDPVLVSSSGGVLLSPEGEARLTELLPMATLITPNLPEAARLLGRPVVDSDMLDIADALAEHVGTAVLLKGGHASGVDADDILISEHGAFRLSVARLDGVGMRGTGCMLSSAIAAGLALDSELLEAVIAAKAYVYDCLQSGCNIASPKADTICEAEIQVCRA